MNNNIIEDNRITISLEAIKHNTIALLSVLNKDTKMLAVVKSNAYGHGSLEVSKAVLESGAKWLGVARVEEGIHLRKNGIKVPILVFGASSKEACYEGIKYNLIISVTHMEHLEWIRESCAKLNKQARIHIKIDTGMNRVGFKNIAEINKFLEAKNRYPVININGIYTHFAKGYDMDFTEYQLENFNRISQNILLENATFHTAATSATLINPQTHKNMVRIGIGLYGYTPVETKLNLIPALRWITKISHIKKVQKGETVGYDGMFIAKNDMLIATLAVGYGDGYLKRLSNRGKVLVKGEEAKIVGRICMDQMMIDVSHIKNANIGDEACLIGRQGNKTIGADILAKIAETNSYEVLLSPTNRVVKTWI